MTESCGLPAASHRTRDAMPLRPVLRHTADTLLGFAFPVICLGCDRRLAGDARNPSPGLSELAGLADTLETAARAQDAGSFLLNDDVRFWCRATVARQPLRQ